MLTYCLKYKVNPKNIDLKMLETKNGRLILSSECTICGSKKSRLLKQQQPKGVLSSLVLKTPRSEIPLLSDTLL